MELSVREDVISLAAGMAAPELYPLEAMAEIAAEVLREEGRAALQYGPTEGHHPLERASAGTWPPGVRWWHRRRC